MEHQDKIYKQFEEAARRTEEQPFARMDAIWNRVEDKLDNKKQRRIAAWWKYTGIAALLLLFMGIGFMLLNNPDNNAVPGKPDSGITVIDTTKVKQAVSPEPKINSGTKTTDDIIVLHGKDATLDMGNGTVIAGDSIYYNTATKKARVWNSNKSTAEFKVNAEVANESSFDTENTLDEVVVVGYGTVKKKEFTGAIHKITAPEVDASTSVTAKTINGRPNTSFIQSLEGQVPGLNIANGTPANVRNSASISQEGYLSNGAKNYSNAAIGYSPTESDIIKKKEVGNVAFPQSERSKEVADVSYDKAVPAAQMLQGRAQGVTVTPSGQPGANSAVVIRGIGSLQSNRDPLYVIDGVPQSGDKLKKMDPKDIKSVTVLKDAGATAIYGSRGSNGVIIITTKNAKPLSKRQQRKQERALEKQLEEDKKALEKEQKERLKAEEAERQRQDSYRVPVDSESYESFEENKFENPATTPLSTFSIDVDNASYTNVRRFLNNGQVVPKDAVRVEEMINFFKYEYPQPADSHPFSINTEYSDCPWNANHKLLRIGLQGYEIPTTKLPASNFVFLIDVSGSMNQQNKLPLLKESMKLLVKNMRKDDHIAIVVYAGAAGLVLPPTNGNNKEAIYAALDRLAAGGSTAGGEGIELAYKTAQEHFVKGGNNRIILATDGDFNVGASSDKDMQTLIEEKRKGGVFLTCLGYGMGNYKDSKLETLADKGNGNYAYIDNMQEADRFLDKEFKGSMFAIAKDVKIQIEFNPKHVQSYRLIGYENRKLRDEDFANDAIDAGELGSGHTVTALYEIIPVGVSSSFFNAAPELKYSHPNTATSSYADELATIKFRYKKPDGDKSTEIVHTIQHNAVSLAAATPDFKFAAAVAWFGLKLRDSQLVPDKETQHILNLAKEGIKNDEEGYRAEFLRMVKRVL